MYNLKDKMFKLLSKDGNDPTTEKIFSKRSKGRLLDYYNGETDYPE